MADVREAQASLRDMVARGPRGATHLPAELDICWGGAPTVMGGARCALCGLDAVKLKKCAACKVGGRRNRNPALLRLAAAGTGVYLHGRCKHQLRGGLVSLPAACSNSTLLLS